MAYCFRHAIASDLKGGSTPNLHSLATLGHYASDTKGFNGQGPSGRKAWGIAFAAAGGDCPKSVFLKPANCLPLRMGHVAKQKEGAPVVSVQANAKAGQSAEAQLPIYPSKMPVMDGNHPTTPVPSHGRLILFTPVNE